MRLTFRNRLAGFLVLTLIVVQALTAVTVYSVTRQALIDQGKKQLAVAGDLFLQQLENLSQRVAEGVQILSLDFALRQAIAMQNNETVLSALRNHGRRVGATRMMLVGLDGKINGDTSDPRAIGTPFSFPDLLDKAAAEGHATAVIAVEGKAYWSVLVPVMAPIPIAFIGADIPLDDAMVDHLRSLSSLPREVVLVTDVGNGKWLPLAQSLDSPEIIGQLLPNRAPPPVERAILVSAGGRRDLVLSRRLETSAASTPVLAVLGLSLDEALQRYHPIILAFAALLAVGLALALAGAVLIARGVARPIEYLAGVARRIAKGDYTPHPRLEWADEIGQLSSALGNMAVAIGEREERIREQARTDGPTGLPNRLSVIERIESDLASLRQRPSSLLMVGLPRLQEIVNTLGHDFRDELMRHVGGRLSDTVGEQGLVGRVADIAFAVWLPGNDAALSAAHRLIFAVGEYYRQGDATVDIAAAVGIARTPEHAADAGSLLQRADIALHDALARSDDRIVEYDPVANPHRAEHLTLMSDLREALDNQELRLHYQPKLDLASGMVGGAEALVRWTHAKRGFVPPDEFIQLAEETGNIRRLTDWALGTGIAQAAEWHGRNQGLRVSVNLSVRDLGNPLLPERVGRLMQENGIKPESIVLEITESAIMGEPDAAIAVLRRLAEMGIDLSIDDFGVGQSSLTYLRRLPVRELKIDKSFVLKLAHSADDAIIVRSIVELGHNLGYKVTAEGIEDAAALAFLREIGCDYGQGYHIAKPLPVESFDRFLAEGPWPVRPLEQAR